MFLRHLYPLFERPNYTWAWIFNAGICLHIGFSKPQILHIWSWKRFYILKLYSLFCERYLTQGELFRMHIRILVTELSKNICTFNMIIANIVHVFHTFVLKCPEMPSVGSLCILEELQSKNSSFVWTLNCLNVNILCVKNGRNIFEQ